MISPIYVGFGYDSHNWISRVIAWFIKAKISHTFFLYKDELFGWVALGANARGFYPETVKTAWSPSYVVGLYAVPKLDLALAMNRDKLGAPYDYTGLVGMTWVEFCWHVLRRRVRNPLTTPHAYFCSAIVAQVLDSDGSKLGAPRSIDPAEVRDACVAAKYPTADYATVIAS
ncbi:MAG TPA: hypothetical protein VMK12_03860 [Anaeromyxobacteraceae bacterium]|nr:hypothetical protein [Anaeromyxobacteraceae bacterium]